MCRPTFWRIIKNKDVEEFKSDPYLATLLNCMLWVFYGILCVIFGSAMYASPLTIMVRIHIPIDPSRALDPRFYRSVCCCCGLLITW